MIRKWWVLASVACGTFMATLDSSIVNIALPTLTKDLGRELFQVKWVVIVYLLVITCTLLPFGRWSDQRGRKLVFQLGFITFVIGSILCGFSPNLWSLVSFRGIQALGASMLMTNGPAIIASTFSARERGAALGTLAMVVSTGLVSGPSIGGFLITHFGWKSIFWVNVPIGILGIILVQIFIKKENLPSLSPLLSFDWAGTFIQTLLLLSYIILLDPPQISISGGLPISVPRWGIGLLVILLSVVFIKIESEAQAPLFDLSLFKNRVFWTANLANFLIFVAFSSVSVLMPFFLEEILHFPPQKTGVFMTFIPLTVFVIAPISGRLSDHLGSRGLSFGGAFIGVIGLFTMAGVLGTGMDPSSDHFQIISCLCLIGLATGLFQSPNNNAMMSCVPFNKLGVASAILAAIRNLGLVTGTGLATSLFTWRRSMTGDFINALHLTLFAAGWVCVGAMLTSLIKRRRIHIQEG